MASGKREGRGSDWGKMGGNGRTARAVLGTGMAGRSTAGCYCMYMYCVGADQETAKGVSQGAHSHPQSGDANEEPGRAVPRSSYSHPRSISGTFAPSPATTGPVWLLQASPSCGGVRPERGTDCAAVGLWSSDRGVAGTTYPCPAENTSHFPTSQGEPFVDQDRPPASQQARSSHLSAFNYSRPESRQTVGIAGRSTIG